MDTSKSTQVLFVADTKEQEKSPDKRALLVFSHPDDESFGPAGTIALWAEEGYEIHLICATKGEIGNNTTDDDTAKIRENELRNAARVLGVHHVNFLGYRDGHIGNRHIPKLTRRLEQIITSLKPQRVMTFNLNGVSGHLDHVALANATTCAFDNTQIADELFYYTLPRKYTDLIGSYFIHFPDGPDDKQIDLEVDIAPVWDKKLAALQTHKSQEEDYKRFVDGGKSERQDKEYFMIRKKK